jgi:3-deoxy-7-phosphoheptulonate synthase
VHPCPEKAISDGAQSLTVPGFHQMMRDLAGYIELWTKERVSELATA